MTTPSANSIVSLKEFTQQKQSMLEELSNQRRELISRQRQELTQLIKTKLEGKWFKCTTFKGAVFRLAVQYSVYALVDRETDAVHYKVQLVEIYNKSLRGSCLPDRSEREYSMEAIDALEEETEPVVPIVTLPWGD